MIAAPAASMVALAAVTLRLRKNANGTSGAADAARSDDETDQQHSGGGEHPDRLGRAPADRARPDQRVDERGQPRGDGGRAGEVEAAASCRPGSPQAAAG